MRAEGQGTKKEQRPHLPHKRGPKCARPGEKESGGWREKGNCGATGEMGRREAKLNSHAYARAAGRGPMGVIGAQPNTPRARQHGRDGGRASPGTRTAAGLKTQAGAAWHGESRESAPCSRKGHGPNGRGAVQTPARGTAPQQHRGRAEPCAPRLPLPGASRAVPRGDSLQLPERTARPQATDPLHRLTGKHPVFGCWSGQQRSETHRGLVILLLHPVFLRNLIPI